MMNATPTVTSAATPSTALRPLLFSRSVALASRQSRWLLAVAALAPMSLAWGYSAPTTATGTAATDLGIGQMPHGAGASCGTATGDGIGCHEGGSFDNPDFSVSLPEDASFLPEGRTKLTASFESDGTPPRFGFHMRADIGAFVGESSATYYALDEGAADTAAKNNNPAVGDLSYSLYWEAPADVEDQSEVEFSYCAQAVDGLGTSGGDGPSDCEVQAYKVNVAPRVRNQNVAVAMNASAPVDFVLRVTGGLVDVSAASLTVTAVPSKGAVTDRNGDAVAVDDGFDLTVTDSSASLTWQYLPNANASGADSLAWEVSDSQHESRAIVTFNIAAPAGGGDDDDGGCALSLGATPSAPASGLLLAALLAMLWRRRRVGLGGDGRACRVAPPAG